MKYVVSMSLQNKHELHESSQVQIREQRDS
jgi:hypothetical protein